MTKIQLVKELVKYGPVGMSYREAKSLIKSSHRENSWEILRDAGIEPATTRYENITDDFGNVVEVKGKWRIGEIGDTSRRLDDYTLDARLS